MKVMIHIGLDVHNDSIAASLAPSDSIEVRRWGIIGGTHEHVQRFIKQVQAAHPDATLKFCYEAGPRGFPLGRFLRGLGLQPGYRGLFHHNPELKHFRSGGALACGLEPTCVGS